MQVKNKIGRRERPSWIRKAGALLATGALVAAAVVAAQLPQAAVAADSGASEQTFSIGSGDTFFAYVGAGETLDVSFIYARNGGADAGKRYQVRDSAGNVLWTCDNPAGSAIGTGCEIAGLTGTPGVWTVTTTSLDNSAGTKPFDWSINVRAAGGADVPGRVWSNSYRMTQVGGAAPELPNLSFWLLNDSGFLYEVGLNGYNGIQSNIVASAIGVADANCSPTYQSGESGQGTGNCSAPYRVFFERPAADLPETAPSPNGEIFVAPVPLTAADLAVDDLSFTPVAAQAAAGSFGYSISERFTGAYELQIDTNGNGSYEDAVDRTVTLGADGSGSYTYDFDGLDGTGAAIADCTLMNARIFFPTIGEIHVTQNDVEGRTGGISVTRQNGPGAPDSTLYWDDTNLADNRTNITPVVDGTAGVDSSAGVHGWAFDGNSWGNGRNIDDWTYVPINEVGAEISIGGTCLVVTKTSNATADSRVGDTITYTVTAQNAGAADYTAENPATVTDDLAGVVDDATYNDDAAADVDGVIAYTEPKLSWSGALPAGDTVTITYTATLTATGDGSVRNVVYGDTPETPTPVCDPPDADGTDPATGIACAENEFLLPRLTITKTASETELPAVGTEVTYTVTATNAGPGVFTADAPAVVTDDLSEVIDDGTYNGDATATVDGPLDYTAPELTWNGALAAGESVTIEYTVTYTGAGDQELINTACIPADDTLPGADPCATVTVPAGLLDVSKSVDPEDGTTVTAGEQLTYTLTFDSIGTAAADVDWTDDLSAVLDDAEIVTAPVASSDVVTVSAITGGRFTVTGSIPAGQTVTVTYTVEVLPNGERGDDTLGNFLFDGPPPVPGTECAAGDPLCTVNYVSEIIDSKSVSPESGTAVVVGQALTYTLTFENIGEGAGVVNSVDYLAGVLDDADVIVEPAASDAALTATRSGDAISITGTLDAGQVVTVSYTVQVRAEAQRGDSVLANFLGGTTPPAPGTVCTPGEGEFPDCTTNPVGDIVPTKTVNPSSGTKVAAGNELTYTLSFRNAGAAAAAVSFTDHMGGVLDDAAMVGTPQASTGLVAAGPTNGQLVITGTVQPGQTATVTYTVRVKVYDQQGNHQLANFLVPQGGIVPGECLPNSPLCTQNPIDPPAGLAVTGGEIAAGVLITGLALLVGGGVLLMVRRRRQDGVDIESIS